MPPDREEVVIGLRAFHPEQLVPGAENERLEIRRCGGASPLNRRSRLFPARRPSRIDPPLESRCQLRRDGEHLLVTGAEDPAEITRVLAGHSLYVRELTPIRPDLESAFLTLTADEGLGSEADRDAGGLATGGAA